MLKDRHGARLTVVSMGPPQATAVLRESLARGADNAVLVSSRAFGGADTLATSYTIAQAIKKACGGKAPDLVLFGKQAIDGDTAQVGPGVSEFLGVPLVTYVRKIDVSVEPQGARFSVESVMDDGVATIEGALPAVMTVLKESDAPRYASLAGAIRATKADVTVLDEKAIEANPSEIGLKGSPTKVVTIFPPPIKGGGEKISATGPDAAKAIVSFLEKKGWVKNG